MINRRDQQAAKHQPPERPFLVVADRATTTTTTTTTNMEQHHDLSPAPLWRNAPVLSTPAAKTSMIMSQVRPHQPVVVASSSSSSSSSSVIQSFQQSLRSYPSSGKKPITGPGAKIRPKSQYDNIVGDGAATRCFVTNLENPSQQPVSSSFFLDYLEWNRQQQQQQQQSVEQLTNNDYGNTGIRINEMAINEHQQQFDHSKFMDMFRTSHRSGGSGGPSTTTKPMICESVESSSSSLVAMNEADDDDQKSLPYSVNNDLENDSRWMKSAKDQHQQPQLQQQQQQSQKLAANSNVVKMRQTRRQVRIQERPKTISFSNSFHPSSSSSSTLSPSMVIRNDNSNPVQPRQTSQLPANPVTAAARPNKLLQKTTTTTTTTTTTRKHQQDCNNLLNTSGKTTTNPTTTTTTTPSFTSVLSFNNNHQNNHHQPIAGMERNSNRSQSNLNQRIQSAAERRSQIEDAKRERAQRQIEQSSVRNIIHGGGGGGGHFPSAMTSSYTHQSTRGEQPFLPGHSTNSSLAFGSTQPRNIDLTRPLVTPLAAQQQRPKSEIFTEPPLPFNVASGAAKMSKTVPDSSGPIYSKDDANYRIVNNQNNHTKFQNSATAPQAPVAEPMVVAKHQQQQQISFGGGGGGGFGGLMGGSSGSGRNMFSSSSSSTQSSCGGGASSFLRAGRRHDPELIPAKDKYLFRDYAAPSSGWSFGSGSHLKKENSMMTCSMTSTKSFQTKNHLHPQSANNGSPGGFGKPKKSYSMNRLDQLAQPRKRVQPRVPISTSFVKGKTTPDSQTPTKSPSSVSAKSSSARLETPKPIPPPKNFAHTPKPQSHPGSKETTPSSGRCSSKKTRPLSQIEVKTDPSVFESPFEKDKDKEDKPGEEDSLAEYKKQLAEKRAQYRKQQEQKLKQLTKSKPDADGHNQDNDDNDDDDDHDGAKNDHKNSNDNKNTTKNTPRVVARRPRSTIIMSTASTGGNVESSPSQTANSDQSNQNNNNNNNSNNNSILKSLADETREVLEKQESNVLTTGAAPTSGADSGHAPTSSDSSASSSSSSSSSSSPSSTSSSSSSSLSSSNEANKQTVRPVTPADGSNLLVDLSPPETDFSANKDGQNMDDNSSLMDISNDSLSKTIIDTNDDKSMEQLERKMDKLSTNEQGQTCDDSSVMQMDKALLQPNSIMTTSFDSSLLHSTSPAALQATAQQMTASPLNANSNSSLTAGQIEERQQEMLKRHEMERQKRKSRIQEILKGRTRKDDGTAGGGGSGGGGNNSNNGGDLTSSADSSLETSGANSMQPPQKRSSLSNGDGANDDVDGGADNNNKTNGHLTTNGGADTDQDLIKTNGFSNDNLLV